MVLLAGTKGVSRFLLMVPTLFLMFSCGGSQSDKVATDNIESMNGVWELEAAECSDGPSKYWAQVMESKPVNVRKKVNNGQTIDYVVDSGGCLQTITSHIVSESKFLFTKYGYQKNCSESCDKKQLKCGALDTSTLMRVQVQGDEMLVSEKSDSYCTKHGQAGPMTLRYRLVDGSKKKTSTSTSTAEVVESKSEVNLAPLQTEPRARADSRDRL